MPTERPVRHFQDDLHEVKRRLLEMGGLAEQRLMVATTGIVTGTRGSLDEVIVGDHAINALHLDVDDRCFKLLALHQPMATDLRAIVAALKINTDLERVADLAVNIAEAGVGYLTHAPVNELIDILRMSTIAQEMLRDALDAYVGGDVALAQQVIGRDDELDDLKGRVFRELLGYMLRDQSTVEPSLDLVLVSRHLERVGDHATNIAEDVIFLVSARDIRHHAQS
ncbi:MAG: phosphate transport system regulatory protein PhoU [Acidobacteria bacterium SCN 69-37]|nr:MAG: phosphate transport system regulatory protein PhoU [Acidobacteria bacterium SCN 69-37]